MTKQTFDEARLDVYASAPIDYVPRRINQAHVDAYLRRRLATTKSPSMHKRLTALIAVRAAEGPWKG